VLTAVAEAVTGVKAADREKQKAAAIGTAVHAGIEWELRRQLGEDAGPELRLPEPAAWAVESWKDWARSVHLEPLAIERTVYCLGAGPRCCTWPGNLSGRESNRTGCSRASSPGRCTPTGTGARSGDLTAAHL
jgi:hypothetical protein